MTKEKKIKIMLGLGIGVAIILLVSVLKALLFGTAYLVAAAAIGAAAFLFAPTIINWLSVKAIVMKILPQSASSRRSVLASTRTSCRFATLVVPIQSGVRWMSI